MLNDLETLRKAIKDWNDGRRRCLTLMILLTMANPRTDTTEQGTKP